MNLILTFDYELFGDGSGCIFKDVITPTDHILRECNKYGIKTTIYVEILEFLKIKKEWERGNSMGYAQNPIEAIEKQVQEAAIAGHDIQLHIHPQWHNAEYVDGSWRLDMENWRLGDFEGGKNYGVKELISECKSALEELVRPVVSDYECIGLRAGGYNIMPSDKVYSAMIELGLKFDSSAYPGGYEIGALSRYDYRDVPRNLNYWWAAKKDIRKSSDQDKDIVEFPIFALPISRWKKIMTFSKIRSILLRSKTSLSAVAKEKISNRNLIEKIKFILGKEAVTWDVCIFSKSLHSHFFRKIDQNLSATRDTFILIGHPKSLSNENIFSDFLKKVARRKTTYSFKSLKQYYEEVI